MFQLNYLLVLLLATGAYTFPESQDYDYGDEFIGPQGNNEVAVEDDSAVDEKWPPIFVNKGEKITLQEGESFRVSCDTVEPTARVVIFKKRVGDADGDSNVFAGHIKLDANTRIAHSGDANYRIDRVTRNDSGVYKCAFINGESIAEAVYELNVLYAPSVIAKGKEIRTIQKDESVALECQSSGNPEPTITWTKEEGKFASGVEEEEGFSITMENVDRHVEGIYRCTADNGIGKPASTTVQVLVQYPPEIFTEKSIIRTGNGDKLELVCIVHSRPTAKVFWTKDGEPLQQDPDIKQMDAGHRHTIIIENVSEELYGSYECNALNSKGQSVAVINLTDTPRKPEFVSPPMGGEDTSYTLVWKTESYYPITEYMLKYKPTEVKPSMNVSDDWIQVEGTVQDGDITSEKMVKTMEHELTGLVPAADYEVLLSVKNTRKWGEEAKFEFSTKKAKSSELDETDAAGMTTYSLAVTFVAVVFALIC